MTRFNRDKVLNEYWIYFLEYCKKKKWKIEPTEVNFWRYYYELEYNGEYDD